MAHHQASRTADRVGAGASARLPPDADAATLPETTDLAPVRYRQGDRDTCVLSSAASTLVRSLGGNFDHAVSVVRLVESTGARNHAVTPGARVRRAAVAPAATA